MSRRSCRSILLFATVVGLLLLSGKDTIRYNGGATGVLQLHSPNSSLSYRKVMDDELQQLLNTSSTTDPLAPTAALHSSVHQPRLPDCLVADVESTRRFVSRQLRLQSKRPPLPIINLGMPKIGTNTLHSFLGCVGIRSTHNQDGPCMRQAHERGRPLLASCPKRRRPQAWMQLDSNYPRRNKCYYPQMSNLEQFHNEAPNATFILTFRPFHDWYKSLSKWHGMRKRLQQCNLPGLPKGAGNATELRAWLCGHVTNVRNFVQRHPSHALIELDLYDEKANAEIMSQLFHANPSCWGHKNARLYKPTFG